MAIDARKRAKAAMVRAAQARVFAKRLGLKAADIVGEPERANGGPIAGPETLNEIPVPVPPVMVAVEALQCSSCGTQCKPNAKGVTIGRCKRKNGAEAKCDMVKIGGSSTP